MWAGKDYAHTSRKRHTLARGKHITWMGNNRRIMSTTHEWVGMQDTHGTQLVIRHDYISDEVWSNRKYMGVVV